MTNHADTVAAIYEAFGMRVLRMQASDDAVAAEVLIDDGEELHLWTWNEDGRVMGMRHYTDTAKHIAAALAGL